MIRVHVFRPMVSLLVLVGLLGAPTAARALDDPIWHVGGGFGYTPQSHEVFEFTSEALALRGGAGARVHGPLRATVDVEHLFFQVPEGRAAIATISGLDEDRSQLTTVMLGLELAGVPWNRSGPFAQFAFGAARVAFGDISGTELTTGEFRIEGETSIRPAFGGGIGFRARPSTGLGPGLQGMVRLLHVPSDDGDIRVVTTSLEVVF